MTSTRSFTTTVFTWTMFAMAIAAQTQTPVFRGSAVLVTVDAYPQQNGRILEGLTPDDFEVLEDGKAQKVENFAFVRVEPALTDDARRDPNTVGEANALAADPRIRVFVAFLDQYFVGVDGSHASRQPLVSALRELMGPSDLFGVMTPKMRGRDLTLGRKLLTLEEELARYWPWGERFSLQREPEEQFLEQCFDVDRQGKPRMVQDGAVLRRLVDVLIDRRREDKTLTSLEDLVAHLGTIREARTAVLLFTDGWRLYGPDNALMAQAGGNGQSMMPACTAELMRLVNLDDARRFRDFLSEANRRNVTFYPINPGGLMVFDEPLSVRTRPNPNAPIGVTPISQDQGRLRDRIETLRTLAENTDGLAIVNSNDLSSGVKRIVNDMSAYYLLGYYSTNTRLDGNYHRITVKMKRPGVSVKARRGYFAPGEAAVAAKAATAAAAAANAASAPVTDALAVLARLRPSAELYSYGVVRGSELDLVAEIPGPQIESGKWAQGGDVRAIATGPNGEALGTVTGQIDPSARAVQLLVPLAKPPAGPIRVDVSISHAGDRLEERTSVEPAGATTWLGSPIMYRAAPGPRSPLRPVADFQFRRTERVHVEWPILKPLDQRQARLLGKNGQPLAVASTVTERDLNGTTMLAVDVNLAPLGPGDYVIEVTAGAAPDSERKFLAFRVVP